jgi:ribosomal protein L37AE/L43A
MQPTVRCPKCLGENVEPRAENWYCRDCDQEFDTAAVQLPQPGPTPSKRRKPAPK